MANFNKFKAYKFTREGVTVCFPARLTVAVKDDKGGVVIERGGNNKDGLHRWAHFRAFCKAGGWKSAKDIALKAQNAYGHSVRPWYGDLAAYDALPEEKPKTWAEIQQNYRKSRKNVEK